MGSRSWAAALVGLVPRAGARSSQAARRAVAAQREGIPGRFLHALGVDAAAELRRHHPSLGTGRDRVTDQRLGDMVAVALGGVDQIDVHLAGAADQMCTTSASMKCLPHSPLNGRVPTPITDTATPVLPNRR